MSSGEVGGSATTGERLGDERLPAYLRQSHTRTARQIADGLMELSRSHAGANAEIADDRTVVVLKAL